MYVVLLRAISHVLPNTFFLCSDLLIIINTYVVLTVHQALFSTPPPPENFNILE